MVPTGTSMWNRRSIELDAIEVTSKLKKRAKKLLWCAGLRVQWARHQEGHTLWMYLQCTGSVYKQYTGFPATFVKYVTYWSYILYKYIINCEVCHNLWPSTFQHKGRTLYRMLCTMYTTYTMDPYNAIVGHTFYMSSHKKYKYFNWFH